MSHGIEAFGYEYLTDGQSSPELTINKNLLANYVLHKGIADRDLTAPPGSPADGAAYIPAATATGAWAGHEDDIAYWFDETGAWKFLVPEVGISIYVDDEALPIRYYGGSTGWDVIAGNGTVTSVDTAGTVAGLTLTGGPITGSGTVTLGGTLSVDLTTMVTGVLPLANITGTTVGKAVLNLTNPSAITFPRFNADNTVDALNAADFRAAIGVGSGTGDVVGPASAVDSNLAAFDTTTGELLKDSGVALANVVITSTNKPVQFIGLACSDETTALTTGTAKLTFRMPYAFTLTAVRASVTTAPTGAVLTVDINEAGTTILSTKLTIDVSEKTSTTAATPAVISDTALADDAEITIDIDTVGSTIAGAGLKVYLIGTRT